jgi:hypothetical protein
MIITWQFTQQINIMLRRWRPIDHWIEDSGCWRGKCTLTAYGASPLGVRQQQGSVYWKVTPTYGGIRDPSRWRGELLMLVYLFDWEPATSSIPSSEAWAVADNWDFSPEEVWCECLRSLIDAICANRIEKPCCWAILQGVAVSLFYWWVSMLSCLWFDGKEFARKIDLECFGCLSS